MIDFDSMDDWEPGLSAALAAHVPDAVRTRLRASEPEFVEDALSLLMLHTDREAVMDATIDWIRSDTLAGHHGSRLTESDLASIREKGLMPLEAENRRARLARTLSAHPRWNEAENRLDAAILGHGKGKRAGGRENQVHLTLSRGALVEGFNHYLTHGSEFDQHVAHALLGEEGEELLRKDGQARVIQVAVPGPAALEAAHWRSTLEETRRREGSPNVVREFLEAWSFKIARPDFHARKLKPDRGLVFRSAVPPEWISRIDTFDI